MWDTLRSALFWGFFAVLCIWMAVGFWRTRKKAQDPGHKKFVSILALLCVATAGFLIWAFVYEKTEGQRNELVTKAIGDKWIYSNNVVLNNGIAAFELKDDITRENLACTLPYKINGSTVIFGKGNCTKTIKVPLPPQDH